MKFADNLKIVRKQKQMTQEDVATKLHVSRKTISSWENERSYPDIGMLVKISEVYTLSIDRLLKEDLGMLKHYEAQTVVNQRHARLLAGEYYAMVGALFISYLISLLGWGGASDRVIEILLIAMTLTMIMNYDDFDQWTVTPRQKYGLLALVIIVVSLNLALVLPNLIAGLPTSSQLAHASTPFLAGEAIGYMVRGFSALFIRPAACVLAIGIPWYQHH